MDKRRLANALKLIPNQAERQMLDTENTGGEGGIRTPGTLSGTPVFKTGAINHSATSPL